MRLLALAVLSLVLAHGRAAAEPVTLRLATVAPSGTAWAREFNAFARDVELLSQGQLKVKWYFGGLAGDELQVRARIAKGQLDGQAAAVSCVDMAPSLKVFRVVGLFRRRAEAHLVVERLRSQIDAELLSAGYVALAVTWFGSDIAFTRRPVRSLDELRKLKLWTWNLDPVWAEEMKLLKLNVVPLPVEEAGRAYDEGRVDGFFALPTAALAFQWSARARYYTDLPVAVMPACLLVASRVFDALPIESQQVLRAAAAKAMLRTEDINTQQEEALLGGLFERQGTQRVRADDAFVSELLENARDARDKLPERILPRPLLMQVQSWLSDYRAVHP